VRAVFYRLDTPDVVLGAASWNGAGVDVQADDESVRQAIRRIFRPTPAVIDDPSMRSYGTAGPVLLPPGSLQWFRAAAETRGGAEGLGARFVPESSGAMGWDPAGAYRTFNNAIERKARIGGPPATHPVQPGEVSIGASV
jgi:hypothetical protein